MCDTFLFGSSPPKKANQPTILSLKVRRLHSHQRITSVPWVSMAWNDTEWHLTNFVLGTRSQNILYVLIISSVTFPYASDAIHLIQSRGRVAAWVSGRFSLIQTSVSKLKISSLFLRCPSWRPCCTANSSVRFLIQELKLLNQTGCYYYEWNAVKWIMGVSESRAELWHLFSFCLEQPAQNIYDWEASFSFSKEPFVLFRAAEKVFRVYTG